MCGENEEGFVEDAVNLLPWNFRHAVSKDMMMMIFSKDII
jgi:hypothetical protein